jgi:hypothetical protein
MATIWTKDELRTANKHPWESEDYCPLALRDYRKVVADADPDYLPGSNTYVWWQAGGDWWGVCPPAGVLPTELVVELLKLGPKEYPTRKAAVAALWQAAAVLDPRISPGG